MENPGHHIPTTHSGATTLNTHPRFAGTRPLLARHAVRLGIALTLALVALAGVASAWAAAASSAGQGAGQAAGGIRTFQACQPGWKIVPSANDPSRYGELYGVSALAPNDIWAVGATSQGGSTPDQPLIEHWDGSAWSLVPNPIPQADTRLVSVAALAPNDVWAVGQVASGEDYQPLLEHWDGGAWNIVAGGNVPQGSLLSVTAISPKDVWAVGYSGSANSSTSTLVEHWDGNAWSVVPTPNTGTPDSVLISISAVSPTEIWAVGAYSPSRSGITTLVERWDGNAWSVVSTPTKTFAWLTSVKALGSNDVWAVGLGEAGGGGFNFAPLVMHWDGSAFSSVQVPDTGGGGGAFSISILSGVAASAPNDVWMVGSAAGYSDRQPLVLHWDGSRLDKTSVPQPDGGGAFNAVALVPNGDLVAVGASGPSEGGKTLVEYNTVCAAPTPSPTKTPGAQPTLPPATLPGSGSRTFPQTGKTVTGLFLGYWDNHGGLAQQGYPISGVFGEVSDLNGQPYTVQYFERAVFEYHPENPSQFWVLLSQLGTYQYKKKYPSGAPAQQPNNLPGSVLFTETGKRLGGRFLTYWQTHGGLPQQGYPISDEFLEKSDLNGQNYLVQYFERAVFEYHPENQPPYDVLLSQLGTFQYQRKYQAK